MGIEEVVEVEERKMKSISHRTNAACYSTNITLEIPVHHEHSYTPPQYRTLAKSYTHPSNIKSS